MVGCRTRIIVSFTARARSSALLGDLLLQVLVLCLSILREGGAALGEELEALIGDLAAIEVHLREGGATLGEELHAA